MSLENNHKISPGIKNNTGIFVISLDFELYWGVRDKRTLISYRENLLGVRDVVPLLLKLFTEYDVHTTWATVGFLFFHSKQELLAALPKQRPAYSNPKFSPYQYIESIGQDEQEDPFHFAPSLVKMISATPNQEIGTHTFSHYYCLEQGQDKASFCADLVAAKQAAQSYNIELQSLVFPRNQFNQEYVTVCHDLGIKAFRGNETGLMYSAANEEAQTPLRRILRLLDTYINLSGHNCYQPTLASSTQPINIPSSRFLRPYSKRLSLLEPLKLRRIKLDLTHAARKRLLYHLWWHPHNFGRNKDQNIMGLRHVLDHFAALREQYGMRSLNMGEIATLMQT